MATKWAFKRARAQPKLGALPQGRPTLGHNWERTTWKISRRRWAGTQTQEGVRATQMSAPVHEHLASCGASDEAQRPALPNYHGRQKRMPSKHDAFCVLQLGYRNKRRQNGSAPRHHS